MGVIGIEFVVADLDRAIELFCDVLGWPLLGRGPSALVVGEMATVDGGSIIVTLLEPASSGDGTVLAERTPRLSQLVLAATDPLSSSTALERVVTAGLSASPTGDHHFHITPESVDGALGQPVAVVVTTIDQT